MLYRMVDQDDTKRMAYNCRSFASFIKTLTHITRKKKSQRLKHKLLYK